MNSQLDKPLPEEATQKLRAKLLKKLVWTSLGNVVGNFVVPIAAILLGSMLGGQDIFTKSNSITFIAIGGFIGVFLVSTFLLEKWKEKAAPKTDFRNAVAHVFISALNHSSLNPETVEKKEIHATEPSSN